MFVCLACSFGLRFRLCCGCLVLCLVFLFFLGALVARVFVVCLGWLLVCCNLCTSLYDWLVVMVILYWCCYWLLV